MYIFFFFAKMFKIEAYNRTEARIVQFTEMTVKHDREDTSKLGPGPVIVRTLRRLREVGEEGRKMLILLGCRSSSILHLYLSGGTSTAMMQIRT
jgi:hypothetical protein